MPDNFEVFWTKFAEIKLDDIFFYYTGTVNQYVAKRIVQEIIDKTISLKNNPYIGQKELLLENRVQEFRYLIHKKHKIIYCVNTSKNRIEIFNVFDTRQNPRKLSEFL